MCDRCHKRASSVAKLPAGNIKSSQMSRLKTLQDSLEELMTKHCKKEFLNPRCVHVNVFRSIDLGKHDSNIKGDVIRQCKNTSRGESVLRLQTRNQLA